MSQAQNSSTSQKNLALSYEVGFSVGSWSGQESMESATHTRPNK